LTPSKQAALFITQFHKIIIYISNLLTLIYMGMM